LASLCDAVALENQGLGAIFKRKKFVALRSLRRLKEKQQHIIKMEKSLT